jgi:hypothetical protein
LQSLLAQSALLVHLAQVPPVQWRVMQSSSDEHACPLSRTQALELQAPIAQSLGCAQNDRLGSLQTPPAHCCVVQSVLAEQAAQTPCAQRPLAQSRSSKHWSPFCSLQKSAAQVPL